MSSPSPIKTTETSINITSKRPREDDPTADDSIDHDKKMPLGDSTQEEDAQPIKKSTSVDPDTSGDAASQDNSKTKAYVEHPRMRDPRADLSIRSNDGMVFKVQSFDLSHSW